MQRPLRASVVHNQEPWLAEYNDWLSAEQITTHTAMEDDAILYVINHSTE